MPEYQKRGLKKTARYPFSVDKREGSQKIYKPWGGGRLRWITKLLDVNINNVFVIGIFGMVYAKKSCVVLQKQDPLVTDHPNANCIPLPIPNIVSVRLHIISRPGRSQGLLFKQPQDSLIKSLIKSSFSSHSFTAPPRPNG